MGVEARAGGEEGCIAGLRGGGSRGREMSVEERGVVEGEEERGCVY